ncbi:DNA polymerase-3 subunit alpha [Mycoplasmopsis mustelae]|uniref:DNA-directed DNA polymerase n=1 Tax=Mycoplasmopsis mustelae TaxID=171289 RepID=A0A4R7UC02_9BACT|nr:DNA polymerase III subunit alpha [Mycoplasmopsis mustelae]TDV23271.1 DNA polymerase-3 subunit alpha [Mycoplasmopsis mustelae]
MRQKIYLHTNTEFSFLSSTIRVHELLQKSKELRQKYITLTDYQNFYALQYYWEFLDEYDFKPIIGVELDLLENFCVIAIAKNNSGLRFLYQLVSDISLGKKPSYYQLNTNDIFVIDHEEYGMLVKNIDVDILHKNFYFNSKSPLHHQCVYAPTKRILNYDDNEILPILSHISGNNNTKIYGEYFDDSEFMDLNDEVYNNMLNLVESINISKPSSDLKLAAYATNSRDIFQQKILGKRYQELVKYYNKEKILQRIKYEVKVIDSLGFIDYFLIIHDALAYARANRINIGPGRGSSSGSLVAYLLEITSVNPLEFDLLFERFLNVDRVSLPDIDIDIQDNRREEVLQYLKNKYGTEKFALISTFQTLASKNSLRDVARYLVDKKILDIARSDIDNICACVGLKDKSLADAYNNNSKYRLYISKFPLLHQLASKIEGFPRQVGLHAAGVLIANQSLNNIVASHYNDNGFQQVEMTMNYLERFGLIKIDFLGLKNLTFMQEIENQLPLDQHFDEIMNQSYSLFNDKITFDVLNKLHTDGIFQLESPRMRQTIQQVHIDSFDDIFAIISLFRPGPVAFIPEYARNKRNTSLIERVHPIYDKIVRSTFGIIVYQEQIMQIAQQVTGMSFSQADLLRRAISKKDESELHQLKTLFFNGGIKNGINLDKLDAIYQKIESFANYGFNKAHAVAYALISYKLAYYKARYPEIFYKTLLSDASADLENIKRYSEEAYQQGILVVAPEINVSSNIAEIYDKKIYLSLLMIKGIGSVAASKIVAERLNHGRYPNFICACLRLKRVGIGDANLEVLTKAGVFRNFGGQRYLLSMLPTINELFTNFQLLLKRKYTTGDDDFSLLMQYLIEEKVNEITFPTVQEDALEQEANEIKYLGSKYTTDNKEFLRELKDNSVPCLINIDEYGLWVVVELLQVKNGSKPEHTKIKVKDQSGVADLHSWNKKAKELLGRQPKTKIRAFIKKRNGYYNLLEFQEVVNE